MPFSATILLITLHVVLRDATAKKETPLVSKTYTSSSENDFVTLEKLSSFHYLESSKECQQLVCNCVITIQCLQLSKFHLPSGLYNVER